MVTTIAIFLSLVSSPLPAAPRLGDARLVPARRSSAAQEMPTVLKRSPKEPYLPAGKVTIPRRLRQIVHKIHPGMTRDEVDRWFGPRSGGIHSDFGIVTRLRGSDAHLTQRRNPQEMRYRFASVRLELVSGRKVSYFKFGKWEYDKNRDVSEATQGAVLVVKITWRYTNHWKHNQYRKAKWFGHTVTEAPFYDFTAGGSPDDVVVRVSKPYLEFDTGIRV